MSEIRDRLTKLINQERDLRGYSTSSPWSNALRPAVSYLELAEAATNPAERFLNAWRALYNLWMMMQQRGEIENVTFTRFITEIDSAPAVRKIALETPTVFLEILMKAQNTLLFDAESKKPREARQRVQDWLDRRKRRGDNPSAEKACNYLFIIGRDLRNSLSHPKLDPTSTVIKKAFVQAGDIFLPLAIAATEAIIERPPDGTTGRVVAYRSFLYPFLKNSDSPFSDYYLERLFPEQELSAFPEDEAKTALKEINQELAARRKELVRADAEETLERWCKPVLFQKLSFSLERGVKIVSEDGVFEPTAVIKKADLGRLHQEYKGNDAGRDLAGLVWVLPWSVSLDAVSDDEEFESLTVMEVAQRALSRADVDWAILTNGQKLRLLSKSTSHKARSFMEIDLVAIAEQWVEREAQLAFRYLLGLCSEGSIVDKDSQDRTRLERALRESEEHGAEISKQLKSNVFEALEELGEGFLAYAHSNDDVLEAWRRQRAPSLSREEFLKSDELLTDIYHESLSLMYRLLFLFYAEGRDLLPMEDEPYRDSYSLEAIRDEIKTTHDDPGKARNFFSRSTSELWTRLSELFRLVNGAKPELVPAYNGGLFDPELHPFLERFRVNDYRLARAIDLLSRTRPGALKGQGRKKVTYRDLDIRHLGSIYEGILEYHAEIADQEKAIVKRGAGGKASEEYVAPSELSADEKKHLKAYRDAVKEDDESPSLPRSCKVTGLVEPGEYYLIYGGRESKRKSSGSYYTPDYIVQYIVENTLGPLVRGENRPMPESEEEQTKELQPLSSDEILDLKVLDPAMGSGHFLVAATEYLARAYGAARIREGKDKDRVMSEEAFVHYKRMIAERCIYGIDKNAMAVELSKLSMWLFTMDKGRPLSFLNHHLKHGNALIGAWIQDLGQPPEFDNKGNPKKKGRRDTKTGNLFEVRFRERVPVMVRDLFGIMGKETLTISDVRAKKALDFAVDQIREPFRNVADIWVGLHFGERADDYNDLLLNIEQARKRFSKTAQEYRAFHCELEFPEVFFDEHGYSRKSGFDLVLGNPPWGARFSDVELRYLREIYKRVISRMIDSYIFFIDRTIQVAHESGVIGLIIPSTLLNQVDARAVRELLLTRGVSTLASLGSGVFGAEVLNTSTIFVSMPQSSDLVTIEDISSVSVEEKHLALNQASPISWRGWRRTVDQDRHLTFFTGESSASDLLNRLRTVNPPLEEVLKGEIHRGVSPDIAAAHVVRRPEMEEKEFEWELLRPSVSGSQVKRYHHWSVDQYLIYTDRETEIRKYPNVMSHLRSFRTQNTCREVKDGKHPWWSLHRPRDPKIFGSPKFIGLTTAKTIELIFDERDSVFVTDAMYVMQVLPEVDPYAFMAILQSKLFRFLYQVANQGESRVIPQVKASKLYSLPYPKRDSNESQINQLRELCDEMFSLNLKVSKRSSRGDAREMPERESVEDAINHLVYQLYGLRQDEIRIVNKTLAEVRRATPRHS